MTDIVDSATRSKMMSGIRSKDTRIEVSLRKELFARGFRYRLNVKTLPGKPDLVLRQYQAVIFVNGCYWHGHNCHLFRLPATNTEFWLNKIQGNRERDLKYQRILLEQGWRVGIVWECALRGRNAPGLDATVTALAFWLKGKAKTIEITL